VNEVPGRHRQVAVEEMDKRLSFLGDLTKRQIIESVRYTEEFG
jgi:hypothetical protein